MMRCVATRQNRGIGPLLGPGDNSACESREPRPGEPMRSSSPTITNLVTIIISPVVARREPPVPSPSPRSALWVNDGTMEINR